MAIESVENNEFILVPKWAHTLGEQYIYSHTQTHTHRGLSLSSVVQMNRTQKNIHKQAQNMPERPAITNVLNWEMKDMRDMLHLSQ